MLYKGYSAIAIDATGNVVTKLNRSNNNKSKHIYIYIYSCILNTTNTCILNTIAKISR